MGPQYYWYIMLFVYKNYIYVLLYTLTLYYEHYIIYIIVSLLAEDVQQSITTITSTEIN